LHERDRPGKYLVGKSREQNVVLKYKNRVRSGVQTRPQARDMGLVDALLAVGGMLFDDHPFDSICQANSFKFGHGGSATVGARGEGDAVDAAEKTPSVGLRRV